MSALPVAVITGGEGDLAQAISARLRESGWQVHAPGRSDLDVTVSASVQGYFSQLDTTPDLLINNAGVTADGLMLRMSEADWDQVLDVNLRGAFLCSQAVLRGMMRRRSGHILQIGSFSALHPPLGQANYAAAKAGLIGLTRSLAKEVGSRNIRVNCVLPGFLETKMTRIMSQDARAAALALHELGRFNTPEDCAKFIETLDAMTHVSGQVFQLDSRAG